LVRRQLPKYDYLNYVVEVKEAKAKEIKRKICTAKATEVAAWRATNMEKLVEEMSSSLALTTVKVEESVTLV
jgi:hypothetical protein